jgi:hypothetical protein
VNFISYNIAEQALNILPLRTLWQPLIHIEPGRFDPLCDASSAPATPLSVSKERAQRLRPNHDRSSAPAMPSLEDQELIHILYLHASKTARLCRQPP